MENDWREQRLKSRKTSIRSLAQVTHRRNVKHRYDGVEGLQHQTPFQKWNDANWWPFGCGGLLTQSKMDIKRGFQKLLFQ